ncbi:MAG: response regulator [Acidobacteriota bacterium]
MPPRRRHDDGDLLSTGSVARVCGVTRDGVVHWIRSGKLAASRTPGGHYRVRRDDLATFLGRSRRRFTTPARHETPRILVVDDEPCLLDLLRELLEGEGYAVTSAEGPAVAREIVAEVAPDLVITDVALPDGGGAGLTRSLRADPLLGSVPVIAITGAFAAEPVEAIYAAGADVLIAKPFRPEHLLGEIRRLLSAGPRPGEPA